MQSAALLVAGLVCLAIHFWCVGRCGALDFATGRRDGLDLKTDCGSNRGFYPRWSIPGLIAALAGVVLLIAAAVLPARAHDHSRPGLNEWLATLHAKNRTWCCNGNDTDAIEDWETTGNRYRVKFRGQWFDVPEESVVDGPNNGGDALLWMNKGYSGASVRCFMPGVMG